MRKVWLLFLPFIFTACHHSDPWHHQAIQNGNNEDDMAKLSYPPSNPHKGLELELIRHGKETRGYLNAYHFSFPSYENNPKRAQIIIKTSNTTEAFVIHRLEGGQRLKLTEACLTTLLQLLDDNELVIIESGHFTQEISTKTFKRHYRDLMQEPSRFIPEEFVTFEIY